MRALGLSELRGLLEGGPFTGWWTELARATSELEEGRTRHQELLAQAAVMEHRSELVQRAAMDAFSDAGGAEAAAARCAADAQELENRALELVGSFEGQRIRASEVWYRLGGAERALEQAREVATAPRPGAERALDPAVEEAEATRRALAEEYEAADRARTRLWAEVEAAWDASFERSLAGHEHAVRSRRIRLEAERLFKEADERRARVRQLREDAGAAGRGEEEAAHRRALLLDRAAREFGCAPGERFLYWRDRRDERLAFVVALAREAGGPGPAVEPLAIFSVGPQRGVEALEPARERPAT